MEKKLGIKNRMIMPYLFQFIISALDNLVTSLDMFRSMVEVTSILFENWTNLSLINLKLLFYSAGALQGPPEAEQQPCSFNPRAVCTRNKKHLKAQIDAVRRFFEMYEYSP